MSSQATTQDGEGYEDPSRLMSKEDVRGICEVVGLPKESVNNHEPMPEPLRLGAGRVRAFDKGRFYIKFWRLNLTDQIDQSIKTLRERGLRAKSHALSLYPTLLMHENIDAPTWAERFSKSDFDYYAEMARNKELVDRSTLAEYYKLMAYEYAMEAMNEYLEPREAERAKASGAGFRTNIQCFTEAAREQGGVLALWEHVAKLHHSDESFQKWWTRAAFARGHAEWLLKEPYKKYHGQSSKPQDPIEPWRLWPPRSPRQSTQDCVPNFLQGLWGPNDFYRTTYWLSHHTLTEAEYQLTGRMPLSSLFGAPDFVFLETSEMGWAQELFGLFSDFAVRSAFEKQTLFRQRYLRKGVYDTLPASASAYHKALAICADDVVYERAIELTLKVNLKADVDIKNSPAERDIENLRRDIQLITARRATMTRQESKLCGFQKAVSDIIHHYSDRICNSNTRASFMVVLALQLELRQLLSPWLLVKAFMSVGGKWKWGLSPPGQPVQAPQPSSGLETIPSFVEMGRIMFIDLKLETIRAQILRNETLQGDELQMALCFRRFLETGQEAQMPLMAMGLRRRRDITIVEYNETSAIKCAEGCTCSLSTQKDRKKMLAAKRKGNEPVITAERQKIHAWFTRVEGPLKATDLESPGSHAFLSANRGFPQRQGASLSSDSSAILSSASSISSISSSSLTPSSPRPAINQQLQPSYTFPHHQRALALRAARSSGALNLTDSTNLHQIHPPTASSSPQSPTRVRDPPVRTLQPPPLQATELRHSSILRSSPSVPIMQKSPMTANAPPPLPQSPQRQHPPRQSTLLEARSSNVEDGGTRRGKRRSIFGNLFRRRDRTG
ncbi:uncharacterized protein Z519_09299 [Cladophialophora bantiana CBS 173.52]|uniref:Uncharacterized protein n=1 Tax=Cladophialophora bantiana (strain ATCC 10958 / CBS 173.52 / CDC B-1940 / NIH 8579) TaxID=1442370 RepID=A0A0D2HGD7_CLAB1|nr:uncharacterized protein Z519_09299 [Cladophialophora bantiana CBS 173.52]KIW89870.1 hypothetical protein Z519_09299 [Cladophialophora bantiana CBS 173.52]